MRPVKKIFRAILFVSLLPLLFSACKKDDRDMIALDTSDPLALAPDVSWAVVVEPYAAFRKELAWNAEAVDYCKQGEIFPILASAMASEDDGGEIWYRFDDGWLPASVLTVYSNKLKAAKAAALLGADQ